MKHKILVIALSQMLGREFIPTKPDPASIQHICSDWGFDPTHVVMVGDTSDDMIAGKQAGTGLWNYLLSFCFIDSVILTF